MEMGSNCFKTSSQSLHLLVEPFSYYDNNRIGLSLVYPLTSHGVKHDQILLQSSIQIGTTIGKVELHCKTNET